MKKRCLVPLSLFLAAAFGVAAADNTAPVALQRPSSGLESPPLLSSAGTAPLILAAPPRDSDESGHRIFDPVADYLSTVLGRKVVYRHPTTWGGYQADMIAGKYDIVFDGPHFNGWRAAHRQHRVIVRIPGEFVYTAVVPAANKTAQSLKRLAGHKICAHAPPNLGTLIMYSVFDNPVRQPVVITHDGYKQIFQALIEGKCEAAMLPKGYLDKFDPDHVRTRVIYHTEPMPQQAFSVGPRLEPSEQDRIAEALLSPAAAVPLANFNKVYALQRGLVAASNGDYVVLSGYLKDQWGY
jgi:ABC-type phosphate/phosphonate transport system substrate-binding protein